MKLKKVALLCLTVLAVQYLCACNTVEGFGKDMKSAGQSMENAAAKHTGD